MLRSRGRKVEVEIEVGDGRGGPARVSLAGACRGCAGCSPSAAHALLASRLAFCAVCRTLVGTKAGTRMCLAYPSAPSQAVSRVGSVEDCPGVGRVDCLCLCLVDAPGWARLHGGPSIT